MRTVFADATYWIALSNPRDGLHVRASQLSRSLGPIRILTSELVLVEVLNEFSRHGEAVRSSTVEFVRQLRDNKNVSVEPMGTKLFLDALEFYAVHRDKEWGLIDCSSFIIMSRNGITEAFTYDNDFEQAGFVALLRP